MKNNYGKTNSGPFIELRELAAELPVGSSASGLVCVFCRGGSSRESSFSITRTQEDSFLYCCHRASCGKSGRMACWGFRISSEGSNPKDQERKLPSVRVCPYKLQPLDSTWLSYLSVTFGLGKAELVDWAAWSQTVETGQLVVPLRDRHQIRRGCECRDPPWDLNRPHGRSKARIFYELPERGPNFFLRENIEPSPIVVVEDALSALKVSRLYSGAALHGTNLNRDSLDQLMEVSKSIVLALDEDATLKSFEYQKQYNLYCDFKVAVLDRDLKYEDDAKIKEIVESAK